MDLTTEAGVVALMQSSTSEAEWNTNIDKVKDANGDYPPFWYKAIVLSGIASKTAAGFGGDAEIHVHYGRSE